MNNRSLSTDISVTQVFVLKFIDPAFSQNATQWSVCSRNSIWLVSDEWRINHGRWDWVGAKVSINY